MSTLDGAVAGATMRIAISLAKEELMGTDYTLSYGTHSTPDEGRCAMEWVSYLAGGAAQRRPCLRQSCPPRILHVA